MIAGGALAGGELAEGVTLRLPQQLRHVIATGKTQHFQHGLNPMSRATKSTENATPPAMETYPMALAVLASIVTFMVRLECRLMFCTA